MLQIFRGKVCNVADLPGGKVCNVADLPGGRSARGKVCNTTPAFSTFDFIIHVYMYFISAVYGMLNIDKLFYINSSFNSK